MLVCLSGPEAVGKTTLARSLSQFGLMNLSTSAYLALKTTEQAGKPGREQQFDTGQQMDKNFGGRWVQDMVADQAGRSLYHCVVDAVRTTDQVGWLRRLPAVVYHVHLTASDDILRDRRNARGDGDLSRFQFDQKPLARVADLTINCDTEGVNGAPSVVLQRVVAYLLARHR